VLRRPLRLAGQEVFDGVLDVAARLGHRVAERLVDAADGLADLIGRVGHGTAHVVRRVLHGTADTARRSTRVGHAGPGAAATTAGSRGRPATGLDATRAVARRRRAAPPRAVLPR